MKTATVPLGAMPSAANLLAENVRIYLQVKSAFEQCDKEIQTAVTDMVAIISDAEATEDEKQRALNTIVEALFPGLAFDFLQNCDRARGSIEAKTQWEKFSQEEATFAERLNSIMASKGLTQEQLAKKIGVGQSAIANLVNRNCRPQRKTVQRIAAALEVEATELWPTFKRD